MRDCDSSCLRCVVLADFRGLQVIGKHTIHNSSHPMQGTRVAGTRAVPAIGTAQARARKIWDYWKLG